MANMKDALINGKVLIVGDGDFSFTTSLMNHSCLIPDQVYTSNLESEASIVRHVQASENMKALKDLGVFVFLETDARDLHNHPTLSRERFSNIIFNFPLADRHNIKKNRALLADFFLSCKTVLTSEGRILVTLCKGQGGTPADQPMRSWHDSWQVVAMATNAGFLLHKVLPFDASEFPSYHSVGFRFQDKSFNVTGALVHVFEEGVTVEDSDTTNTRAIFTWEGKAFSCSSYVASSLKRDLLKEPRHPLCILRERLEKDLSSTRLCDESESFVIENSCHSIIPCHKSMAYYLCHDEKTNDSDVDASDEAMETTEKDRKNNENMEILSNNQLMHGVVAPNIVTKAEDELGVDDGSPSLFLTSEKEKENVYILIRAKDKDTVSGRNSNSISSEETCMDVSESEADECCGDNERFREGLKEVCGLRDRDNNNTTTENAPPTQISNSQDSSACVDSSTVFHIRTSLLENLPHVCRILSEKQTTIDNHTNGKVLSGKETVMTEEKRSPNLEDSLNLNLSPACPSSSSSMSLTPLESPHSEDPASTTRKSNDSLPCLVTSGQCMLPCPISPGMTPIKHEMLILHQIPHHPSNRETPNLVQSHFEAVTNRMLSLVKNIYSQLSQNDISVDVECKSKRSVDTISININEKYNAQLVSYIVCNVNEDSSAKSTGSVLSFTMEGYLYHVTIINLQQLFCDLCGIDDPRLLWSESEKFLGQFQIDSPFYLYRPFSLYPMKFIHDLSFWEKETESFDELDLYEAVRNIAGDLVVNVRLIDIYEEPNSNRKSHCYRLYFVSPDKCLPYVTSWKLQSRIRIEVARSLGVQLR